MLKITVHGFLSGLGFLLAVAAMALTLYNPFLAFIPAVLLSAFWRRRRARDLRNGLAALRASRGERHD
jgi:ABC-type uncharacterized transport system permease subunit